MLDRIVNHRLCVREDASWVTFLAHTANECWWQELILRESAVQVLLTAWNSLPLSLLPLVPARLSCAHLLESPPQLPLTPPQGRLRPTATHVCFLLPNS